MENRYSKLQLNQLSTLDLLLILRHMNHSTYEDVCYFELVNVIILERLEEYEEFIYECLDKKTDAEMVDFYNRSFTSLEQC